MSKASDYGLSDERFKPVEIDYDLKALVALTYDADGFVFKYTKQARDEIDKEFDWVSDSWCPKTGFSIGAKYLLLVDASSYAYIVDMEYLSAMINSGIRITIDSIKAVESDI